MKIHRVTGRNRYCGPHVMSAITGVPTHDIATRVRAITGRTKCTGVHAKDLETVLIGLGHWPHKIAAYDRGKGPTLNQWLTETKREPGKLYIVCAGWHWQLIEGDNYTCARVRKLGVSIPVTHDKVKRKARISDIYEMRT